ncbi:hypothetical protein [Streptomyces sp. NPDC047315]|uniref:hypothetical protein n=1 Tax=Streptomyces sp. NPDC047315 TaxID=3155142 RepID=UPI0033C0FB19
MSRALDIATGTIHLQGMGRVPAIPAPELKVGDQLMYNGGSIYQVSKIEDASPKYYRVFEVSAETGEEYNRRVKKDWLVARAAEADRRRLGHDAPTTAYRAQVYAPLAQTWTTVSYGATVEDAVKGLTTGRQFSYFGSVLLERHGLAGTYDTRVAAVKAMEEGQTLTAEDGHRFRILPPEQPAKAAEPAQTAPAAAPARPTITVTTGFTRKSIPTRLRESGAPGKMVYSESAGAPVWRLPGGVDLTPGEAVHCFLPAAPDGHRQIVDRSVTGPGEYWVGGPCGRGRVYGGAQGARLYEVRRTDEGLTTTPEATPEHAEVLRRYLTGPRPVRVLIYTRDQDERGARVVLDTETVVLDGPDPDDCEAWTVWLRDYGKAWLATHRDDLEPGEYHAVVVDPRAADCAGFQGLDDLAPTVDLTGIPAQASGLSLGDFVEYDGRVIDASEEPHFVPGGRGWLRDVWTSDGETVARVERVDGGTDAPALKDLRPATTTVTRKSSELRAGDIVRTYGMRVRLDALHCPPSGSGEHAVYSWSGTVLNLAEVLHEEFVPPSYLRTWAGRTVTRDDAWTVQGSDLRMHAVEVPESNAPEPPDSRPATTASAAQVEK